MSLQLKYGELIPFCSRDLSIDENQFVNLNGSDREQFEQLRLFIIKRVEVMLDADFAGLLNVLYRADVSEEKLKLALADNPNAAAEIIADAYINRQLQKIETRKKYSQGG